MFDFPELREHTDALWAAWASELHRLNVDAPSSLIRPDEALLTHWRRPELFISQACGFPYAAVLRPSVTTFGTFAYEIPEERQPGFYRSVIVARTEDHRAGTVFATDNLRAFNGATVAINATDSLSGCVSLGAALVNGGVTQVSNVVVSGGHANTLAVLQRGEADIAAIDAVTFALLGDVRPAAVDGITIIERGPRIPCLPLITGSPAHIVILQSALVSALVSLSEGSPEVLRALRIVSAVFPHEDDYTATLALGDMAATLLPVSI